MSGHTTGDSEIAWTVAGLACDLHFWAKCENLWTDNIYFDNFAPTKDFQVESLVLVVWNMERVNLAANFPHNKSPENIIGMRSWDRKTSF